MTPAATKAEYWPIEWPAAKAGVGAVEAGGRPAFPPGLEDGDRRREQGGLGVLGPIQSLGGAVPGEFADALTQGGVGGGEDGRGGRRGRGEVPAHAHGLRALAGEDEGDR